MRAPRTRQAIRWSDSRDDKKRYQRLAERDRREKRCVGPFEHTGFDPAGHRQMTGEKLHCLFQQLQCVAMKLPLIEEFRLVVPAEAGHSELALRVIWQHAAPEYYNRGIDNAIMVAKSEAVKHISGVADMEADIRPAAAPSFSVLRISS